MSYTPKIDAFGKVSIDSKPHGDFRLIETGEHEMTLFKEDGGIEVLQLEGKYQTKARKLNATLTDGRTLLFVRAGCGCQTPSSLRGPRSRFLAQIDA